jgi:hypothetical protein
VRSLLAPEEEVGFEVGAETSEIVVVVSETEFF